MKNFFILFISLIVFSSCTDYTKKQTEAEYKCQVLNNSIDSLQTLRDKYFFEVDSFRVIINNIQNNQESRERNDKLIAERKSLENNISTQKIVLNKLQARNDYLAKQVNANDFALKCKKTIYIVKIRIHQTTYTVSVSEYIKNKINDIEFEIPVDKSYYDNCKIGQKVSDPGLKIGSLIMDGDFSKLNVKIVDKRTMTRHF